MDLMQIKKSLEEFNLDEETASYLEALNEYAEQAQKVEVKKAVKYLVYNEKPEKQTVRQIEARITIDDEILIEEASLIKLKGVLEATRLSRSDKILMHERDKKLANILDAEMKNFA